MIVIGGIIEQFWYNGNYHGQVFTFWQKLGVVFVVMALIGIVAFFAWLFFDLAKLINEEFPRAWKYALAVVLTAVITALVL